MLIVYNILFGFFLIVLSPLLFLIALIGRYRPLERLGFIHKCREGTIWIHSASVGEANVAAIIRDMIEKIEPNRTVMFTSNTPHALKKLFVLKTEKDKVCALPLDFYPIMQLAFKRARPSCVILVETEIWPNMLLCARTKKIPIFLLNGRITKKTMNWAKCFPVTFRFLSNCIKKFVMKSQLDAENLKKCGVPESKIEVLGNIKFAGVPGIVDPIRFDRSPVIVAGSVRSREFPNTIRAFISVAERFPDALFVFAPRHTKSIPLAVNALQSANVSYAIRSKESSPGDVSFYLLDTMGELVRFYASADVAFIGGTLAKYGGHNPLEPAYFGVPVLFGPHNYANKEAYDILIEKGGGKLVKNSAELADFLIRILGDRKLLEEMGSSAKEAVAQMRSIPAKYEALVEGFLKDL